MGHQNFINNTSHVYLIKCLFFIAIVAAGRSIALLLTVCEDAYGLKSLKNNDHSTKNRGSRKISVIVKSLQPCKLACWQCRERAPLRHRLFRRLYAVRAQCSPLHPFATSAPLVALHAVKQRLGTPSKSSQSAMSDKMFRTLGTYSTQLKGED